MLVGFYSYEAETDHLKTNYSHCFITAGELFLNLLMISGVFWAQGPLAGRLLVRLGLGALL